MTKQPRISVSARFYAKDLPKGHLGLRSENWSFGKESAVSLSKLIADIAVALIEFELSALDTGTEEINKEIQAAAKLIAEMAVKEHT